MPLETQARPPYNIVQVRVFFPLNIDLGPAMHLAVEKGCQVDVSCLNIGHCIKSASLKLNFWLLHPDSSRLS
jgi:hypothetical protein